MKSTAKYILILAIAALMLVATNSAQAQRRAGSQKYARGYQPSKPTLSPYLNYFRLNTGVLPNYQQFVRPQIQLQKTLQQQQAQIQSGKRSLQQLDKKMRERLTQPTVSPTGHSATFMNFSHYFPKRNRQ